MTGTTRRTFSIARTVSTFGVPLVLIGFICLFRESRSSVGAFFNLQTLFVVAGLPFFLLLGSHGKKFIEFLPEAMKTLFFDPAGQDTGFVEIARDGERFSLVAGMIGVVIGLILLMSNLDDPTSIGPSMALSILSMAYGIVFAECFFAVVARAYQAGPSGSTLATMHWISLVFGGIFALLCCFFLMLFAFSPVSEPPVSEQNFENTLTEISLETNLGEIPEGHTIQFRACLNISDPRTKEIINSLLPAIQERIIQLILKKKYIDMGLPSAYETLKEDVTSIVNSLLKENGCPDIPSVIFSEFLIK
ncbi:MAG: flagellar basal body-associated FliL family protein [Candidatus Riflebacteria bacterium]|nr:flagellar basal body-associated FliL family protein [Candidatus Riflebacteria bacterium]